MRRSIFIGVIAGLLIPTIAIEHTTIAQEERKQEKPSQNARKAVQNFQYADRFQVNTYASEPLLKNPVTFTIDRKGRVYVGETHRWRKGVSDNRDHWYWLMDDLSSRTTKDRLKKMQKWADKGKRPMSYYRKYTEKVRRLRDTDGDGVAERSNLYAANFDSALAGPMAGLLFYRDELFATSIPYLWKLADRNGDGVAEKRKKLHSGFGVRTSLSGHDMHGLALGPDGRIYFSIGDRGFHVQTDEGKTLRTPMDGGGRGAVFRCEPDGSNLEIVHRGLRNPQELAFDQYGNLFTVDNDSDAKDTGRLVYVVEGGDSGWMMSFQYMDRWDAYNSRGAWQAEGLWKTHFDNQPDWIVPPIAHPVGGPAGLTHYPGTGFGDRFQNRFFVCDFQGGPKNSGIQTFSVRRHGASFKMPKNEHFFWRVLATDVDFGYDGKMYVTDWVNGWGMPGKGRIYTLHDPEHVNDKSVTNVEKLFHQGFQGQPVNALAPLLRHPDQRVRQRAHLELARKQSKPAINALKKTALNEDLDVIPRLHGIWGLGIIARRTNPEVLEPLESLLASKHSEVRSQVLWVMGEAEYKAAADQMMEQLSSDSKRVQYFAAQALADIECTKAREPVFQMIRNFAPDHPYLKHAGVELLEEVRTDTLLNYTDDSSKEVRIAAVLALRRKRDPRVARFLNDSSLDVVAEAARAIYDLNMKQALPELAGLLNDVDRFTGTNSSGNNKLDRDALMRRAMSASFRLRSARHLRNVATFASRNSVPNELRKEAIDLLKKWADPKPIDPVLGRYLPLDSIKKKKVRRVLADELPKLLTSSSGGLQSAVTKLASAYNLEADDSFFVRTLKNTNRSTEARVTALEYLAGADYKRLLALVQKSLQSQTPALRIKAREVLADRKPKKAFRELKQAIQSGSTRERQAALATMAKLDLQQVDSFLADMLDRLLRDEVPHGIRLDLLQAARKRSSQAVKNKLETYEKNLSGSDPLAGYRVALRGGDPSKGRHIFRNDARAQCMRCHQINGMGGKAGPDLSDIGSRKDREYILRSMIQPGADIASGYQLVTVQLKNGDTVSGTVDSETNEMLSIATAAGDVVRIKKDRVKERSASSGSSMPSMKNLLSKEELRHLVSYLSRLNGDN
jgi:quinoprotein glucose dehydrogenase